MKHLDWTHKHAMLTDVRKLNDFYIFTIGDVDKPLIVKKNIFEERLKQYFLVNNLDNISRKDIISLEWNFYITKGYYIKVVNETNDIEEYHMDPDKYYVSFLEIDGELGTLNK